MPSAGHVRGAEILRNCVSDQLLVQRVASLKAHEGVEHVSKAGMLQLYTYILLYENYDSVIGREGL